jgi:hypothetical protein
MARSSASVNGCDALLDPTCRTPERHNLQTNDWYRQIRTLISGCDTQENEQNKIEETNKKTIQKKMLQ